MLPLIESTVSVAAWSDQDAIAYECAREALTEWMAILTHHIEYALARTVPDAESVEFLRSMRADVARLRANLHVTAQDEIASIRQQYGEMIRLWRSGNLQVIRPDDSSRAVA